MQQITRKKALSLLSSKKAVEDPIDISFRTLQLEERSILSRLRAEERKNIIEMRKNWSRWMLFCIVFIVLFDVVLISLLGFHVISFESQWVIPAFIADNLAKVLGLAAIIVKFLFGKDSFDANLEK